MPTVTFFALSLYNAQRSKVEETVVPRKSVLHISKLKFKQVSVTGPNGKQWSYPSVRVAHPADVNVVGRGTLGGAAVAAQVTSGAERIETKPVDDESCLDGE